MKRLSVDDQLCGDGDDGSKLVLDLFPDDVIFEICEFFDTCFVLTNCVLISHQWFRVVKERVKLFITIRSFNKNAMEISEQLLKSQFLENIVTFDCAHTCCSNKSALFRRGVWDNISNSLLSMKKLTKLNVSTNLLGSEGTFETICKLKQLQSFDTFNNQIGVEGAKLISGSELKYTLTHLNISRNRIGVEGAKLISELKQLTSLNISSNQIDVEGTKSISSELKQIMYLNIASNGIGDEGAKSISSGLKKLTNLNVTCNQIGVEGAKSISSELKQLTRLVISTNQIGDEGAKAICELKQLTALNIRYNKISVEGNEYIKKNSSNIEELIVE